jgi:hypothetical protein
MGIARRESVQSKSQATAYVSSSDACVTDAIHVRVLTVPELSGHDRRLQQLKMNPSAMPRNSASRCSPRARRAGRIIGDDGRAEGGRMLRSAPEKCASQKKTRSPPSGKRVEKFQPAAIRSLP